MFMSLAVVFNLNDYAILATDRRGLLNYRDQDKEIILSIDDNYKKLRQVPFGFFASTGDYLMASCFYNVCMKRTNLKRSLEDISKDAYHLYDSLGLSNFTEITTIFLIAKGFNQDGDLKKDAVLTLRLEPNSITIEEVDTMSVVARMATLNPDATFWDKIGHSLRESSNFPTFEDFFNYHVHLIKYIWQEQLKFDELISHHIDFYFHDRRTSKGALLLGEEFKVLPTGLIQQFSIGTERVSTSDKKKFDYPIL